MHKKLFFILSILFLSQISFAQDDIQIGSPYNNTNNQRQGGMFDYSDPSSVNIKVQLWGYVKFPGFYIVPARSTINELISLAGGPNEDALLSDIRVLKTTVDSTTVMLKYNYNDLMWEDSLKTKIKFVRLQAGDIIIVPGEPRYFVRQDISFYLSVVTALASLAALIISITK
ncbi:MAG TPA: SLBB domain-containing protein [Ignavibacteriaceae bacterium]|nr:SLBB domain-containing protein [Ignavibacteriaceae bacterium]